MDEVRLVNENAKWNPMPLYQFSSNTRNFEPINFNRPGSLSNGVDLGNVDMEKITVLSLNILFDHYDKEKIFTTKRYPLILDILEDLDADIIALQEVTDVFLKYLVKSTWIINNNYYITEIPGGQSCDPYGNLIISKYPFALELCRYSPTKRVIAGFWKINNKIFGIPVVHLISNQGGGPKRREKEMQVIWKHMSKVADEILIVGDFNFREVDENGNSVTQNNQFVDIWKQLYPNDHGITFNPIENLICKVTSERGLPFRYDRHYLRSRNWKAKSIEVIANNPSTVKVEEEKELKDMVLYPSDHHGLFAVYEFSPSNKKPENTISNFIQKYKLVMDEKDIKERNEVIDQIKVILEPLGSFRIQPIGSYLLGSATASSDIDLICLGTLPTTQFATKALQLLNNAPQVKHVRNVSDALVPILVIHVTGNIKLELQYGCVTQSEPLDTNLNFSSFFNFQKMSKLDSSTVRVVNGFFDTDIILGAVPDKFVYSQALCFVKAWAKNNGIDNNKMGFIGGLGWSIMLAHVHEKTKATTPEELIRNFFKTFSEWDWKSTPVALSCVNKIPEHDPEREWLPILQPTRPFRVITRNSTHSSSVVVKLALSSTYEKIKNSSEVEWEDLCINTTLPSFRKCKAFVKVTLSSNKRNDFIQLINFSESRFVSLICQFEAKFNKHILLHPLPKPLVNKHSKHIFSWYYLFGIYHIEDPYGGRNFDFASFLQTFENEINTWQGKTDQMLVSVEQVERKFIPKVYYNLSVQTVKKSSSSSKKVNNENNTSPQSTSPLSTSPLSSSPLSSNPLTNFNLISDNTVSFSFSNNTNEAPNNTNVENNTNVGEEKKTPTKPKKDPKKDNKKDNKKNKKGNKKIEEGESEKKGKFRPSQDVYKKIKYNPNLDPSEFVIGYEDRFTGIQEIPFDEFLADKLNPKGIPMHRIWYFKKNGEVVWDREKRIDKFEKDDEEDVDSDE